jgi:hypothetical protein
MIGSGHAEAARAFFDEFVRAFSSFSGAIIARRYAQPYLALHSDGTRDLCPTMNDSARYFQGIVDGYREQGAKTCSYKEMDVVAIGRGHVLATVTWQLHDSAGGVVSEWRESYTLASNAGEYRITTSIDH